jgi:surface polysaccharide O-acyltransferase-like enzyme
MDKELSRRLNILRFPLIVGIVFIHNYGTSVGLAGEQIRVTNHSYLIYFLENIISMGIARTAVPLFFLMSGYLFFFGLEWNSENYAKKLKSRASSLLVPFLFWNLLTLLSMAVAQRIPAFSAFFSGRFALIADYGPADYIAAVFGIGRAPISYQFWFIRDLMMLVLATPLIHMLNQRIPALTLVTLFVCWFVGLGDNFAPSSEATLFFCAGCYLGMKRKNLMGLDQYGSKIATFYAVLLIATTIFFNASCHEFLYRLGILAGVVSMLYLTRWVAMHDGLAEKLVALSVASFFVYAAHEPALTLVRKLAYKYLRPETATMALSLYFLIPALLIAVLLLCYFTLQRTFPRFTGFVTGGR